MSAGTICELWRGSAARPAFLVQEGGEWREVG